MKNGCTHDGSPPCPLTRRPARSGRPSGLAARHSSGPRQGSARGSRVSRLFRPPQGIPPHGSDSTALPKSGAHPGVVSQTNAITERVIGHDRLNGTMRTHVNPAFRSAMNELRQLFLKVAGDFLRRFEMCDKSPIATSARLDMSVFEYKCLNTMEGKHGSAGVRAQAQ